MHRSAALGVFLLITGGCGGSTKPGEGEAVEADPCAARTIDAHCTQPGVDCPWTSDQVTPVCAAINQGTTRSDTDCNGSVVTVVHGLSTESYYFDYRGRLVGFTGTSDSGPSCGDGSEGPSYGEVCEPVGTTQDLCP